MISLETDSLDTVNFAERNLTFATRPWTRPVFCTVFRPGRLDSPGRRRTRNPSGYRWNFRFLCVHNACIDVTITRPRLSNGIIDRILHVAFKAAFRATAQIR